MARFTSIGMPRKSFVASAAEEAQVQNQDTTSDAGPSAEMVKKKTHRAGKKLQRKRERAEAIENGEGSADGQARAAEPGDEDNRSEVARHEEEEEGGAKRRKVQGWGRDPDIARKAKIAAERSEVRRLQRIAEKESVLTCFACRGVGHTARDCSNVLLAAEGSSGSAAMLGGPTRGEGNASAGVEGKKGGNKMGADVTGGRCYRCNGTDHSLSACRKRTDPSNPTPYATCFVCLATGHLSAQCPQNVRGVYINGGACKICGDVKHRAKDCPKIKAKEEATEGDFGGGWEGRQVGADEDDFMVQSRERRPNVEGKRRKHAPANNGKREVHQKDPVGDGVGGVSGGVRKVETAAPKPKAKVVSF